MDRSTSSSEAGPRTVLVNGARLNWVCEHYAGFWNRVAAGEWEPHTYREIERHVTAETVFVDVGANIGAIALYAARKASRVICLEPDPISRSMLAANVAANPDLGGRIAILPKALHRSGQPLRFGSQGAGGDSMSSAIYPDFRTAWTVDSVTPDALAAMLPPSGQPVFVKMDIEGGEYDLIPAAGALWRRPGLVLLLSTHQNVLQRFTPRYRIRFITWRMMFSLRRYRIGLVTRAGVERRTVLSALHRAGLAAPLAGTDWLFTPGDAA